MLWKVLRIVFINITLLLLTSTINAKTLKKATLLKWTQVYSIPGYDYSSYNKFIKTEDYTKLKALNLDDLIPQQKGLLKKGVKVEIIEESNDYLHVRYKKDKNSEYTQGWATKSVFKIPKKKAKTKAVPLAPRTIPKAKILPVALPKKKLPKANPQKKNRDTKPQYSKKNSSKHQGPWSARKSACMAPPGIVTQTNCNEWRELDEPAFESELDKICKGIEKFCGLEANQSSKQNSSQIVSNINEIPIECINASLIKGLQLSEVRGKKATDGTENFVKCDTPTSSMKNSQKPCLTNNLIRYTHIMMNMAVKCINTSEPQLQAKELLSVINHESRFIHNVNNPGGKGVMQLTSIAIKDVTLKKGASFSIWDEVKNNKECQAFNAPVQNIIDSMNSSKTYRACQVLNPKDGVKANIAIGLSLFKQYLTRTPLLLNKNIISFTSKKEKHAAQAKLTRLIYNRGEGPVAAALRTIKKRNDRTAKDIIEEVQWRMGEIAEEYGYNYSGDIERDKAILDNDYNSNYNNERQKLLNKLPKLKSKRVNSSSKVDQFIYKSISSSKLDKLIDKTRRYSGAILYSDSQDELNEISQAYRKSVKSYFKIDDSLVDSTIEKLQKFYSNTESLVIEEIEDKQGVLKCNRHIK